MKARITKRWDRENLNWVYSLDLHSKYVVSPEAEAIDPNVDDNVARALISHLYRGAEKIYDALDYEISVVTEMNDHSVDI